MKMRILLLRLAGSLITFMRALQWLQSNLIKLIHFPLVTHRAMIGETETSEWTT
jgi:hypothetical protein